ncbi:hypothetical protein BKA63DRAFT_488992 [Paraphoma chrysanthemicola]|nr:hypothetical protein BKA63DRAFT_488992 [Paraphoma chrysanthemicola]
MRFTLSQRLTYRHTKLSLDHQAFFDHLLHFLIAWNDTLSQQRKSAPSRKLSSLHFQSPGPHVLFPSQQVLQLAHQNRRRKLRRSRVERPQKVEWSGRCNAKPSSIELPAGSRTQSYITHRPSGICKPPLQVLLILPLLAAVGTSICRACEAKRKADEAEAKWKKKKKEEEEEEEEEEERKRQKEEREKEENKKKDALSKEAWDDDLNGRKAFAMGGFLEALKDTTKAKGSEKGKDATKKKDSEKVKDQEKVRDTKKVRDQRKVKSVKR